MMSDGNFPPPSGVADQIAAKAIECLDRDIWHELTDNSVTIRSVKFWLEDVTIRLDSKITILACGTPSIAYQQAFRESYKNAMARKRERLMAPKLAAISNENFGKWRSRLRFSGAVAGILIGGFLIVGMIGGISSCSEQARIAEAAEKARYNEVNKYGFKYGLLSKHYVWPDDCEGRGVVYNHDDSTFQPFRSIYDCKQHWEEWERRGDFWVDWKDEP